MPPLGGTTKNENGEPLKRSLRTGDAIFEVVKGNQPLLQEDIALLFAEAPAPGEERWEYTSHTKGHGRVALRRVVSSEQLNGYLD